MPERVERAFATAGAELRVRAPRVAYLDVSLPVATTVFGPVILLSRGFANILDDDELLLVARHELVHAIRHHATVGVLWHLVFTALVLPGLSRSNGAYTRRASAKPIRERPKRTRPYLLSHHCSGQDFVPQVVYYGAYDMFNQVRGG